MKLSIKLKKILNKILTNKFFAYFIGISELEIRLDFKIWSQQKVMGTTKTHSLPVLKAY